MKPSKVSLGAALVIVSSLFYASYGIWTKLLGDSLGGYIASGIRSVLVVAILFLPALFMGRLQPLDWRKNKKVIGGMFVASGFVWGPFYWAVLKAGVATTLTINYASIVIAMMLLGAVWFGEKLTLKKLVSLVLGLGGLGLVFTPAFNGVAILPFLAAALSGVCASIVMLLTKRLPYNPTQSTLVVWSVSALANLPLAFLFQEPLPSFDNGAQWGYLVMFAVASIAASWMFITALRFMDAGTASILGLFEIVFAVLFGIVLFHEKVGLVVMIGVALIMLAATIPYVGKKPKPKRRTKPA